ncbi:imidazolonepropionase [Aliikangiella coralliicola]|uniref:Imidazolonepropionase n=1 Tax=Aliikangiella coralliicola TaxID=2592383 RepID=A0A545U4Q6_9GAMM|nr:imidazolonepropionase [Aliikangiella coralliicola]TQV84448.1 imidazolonepropionase [Aliikangiella coralliicola]
MSTVFDLVIHNVNLATMAENDNYGIINNAAVCIKDGQIDTIISEMDKQSGNLETEQAIDAEGRWMTPGLIDCHTHLVYGGNRANEFEMRLEGASYEEIAKAGGGIVSTVKATRETDKQALFDAAAKRLTYLIDEGVTTVEIKSGYGLDLDTEQKMLEVASDLGQYSPVEVSKTFLGAHAVPPEYKEKADDYIDLVCEQMMPALHQKGLIDCVDAFCEGIGFSVSQTQRVFEKAKSLGLPVKLHAEQLSDLGGSRLACEFEAWSVDHLEFLNEQDIPKLKHAGTVATLLPGAFYFLNETQLPPIEALRKHQVPIAIATDSNPGSSPCLSLLLMLNMATTLFKLTPFEALQGVTINAAKALNISHKVGSIAEGKQADLVLWDINSPAELSYRIGGNPCHTVIKKGEVILAKG